MDSPLAHQHPRADPAAKRRRPDLRVLLGLLALAGAAAVLRSWALDWGLPSAGRYYPYHPDETVLLDAVCQVNPLWGRVTPHFYNYGTLYVFLCRLAYDFTAPFLQWGPVPRGDEPFSQWVGDFARLLLVGRIVAVSLGVGTVLLTWGIARRLYGARAAWFAALFLAVAPMHVLMGHYMAVDVPAAFFSTLALYGAARALDADRPRQWLGWMAAAGAAAGLAAGTKYGAVTALAPLAVPLWEMGKRWKTARGGADGRRFVLTLGAAAAALAAAGAAFLLSTPGALLETARFLKDVIYEMEINRTGLGLLFVHTPPAWLYHLVVSLPVGLEWPLFLLALAGTGWALRRRSPGDVLLLLFLIATYLTLAPAARKFLRYVIPLLPVLAVFAARLLDDGLRARRAPVWGVLGAVSGLAALLSTIAHLGVLALPDARDRAAEYLSSHAASGDTVALADNAWFFTPPIDPTAGCVGRAVAYGGPPAWDRVPEGRARPDLYRGDRWTVLAPASYPAFTGSLAPDQLRRYRPRFVVISDYEYEDPARIRRADPTYRSGTLAVLAVLEREYRPVIFRPRPSLLGFTWWRRGTPPHDWRYYMPEVRVYERK